MEQSSSDKKIILDNDFRSGFVTICGLPNVGKSTLLNSLLNTNLSIVSPKPQTTRYHLKGILTKKNYQIVFIDTPGYLKPSNHLEKIMKNEATRAIKDDADIIILLAEPDINEFEKKIDFFQFLSKINKPLLIAINKIDIYEEKLRNDFKEKLKSIFGENREIIEISALKKINTDILLKKIIELLPKSPPYYYDNILSDRWERYFVSEIIREKIFNLYHDEIPYSTAVEIVEFRENEDPIYIYANIYVSKKSHKPIIIGKDGNAIYKLRTQAQKSIEEFLNKKVKLELFVKVRENWMDDPLFLNNLIGDYK
jgi:GTP-binding protein Era